MSDPTVVESTMVRRVLDHAVRLGVDPQGLLDHAGLDAREVARPDALVPFAASMAIYDALGSATGDRAFGLDIARAVQPRDYGLIGLLWEHHPTLAAAFQALAHYYTAFLEGNAIRYERGEHATTITSTFAYEHPGLDVFRAELLASVYLNARAASDVPWTPDAVRLSCTARAPERFEALFGVPVTFDADEDAIVIANSWLDRPNPRADEHLLLHLLEAAETHLVQRRKASGQPDDLLRLHGCTVDLGTGRVRRGTSLVALTTRERELMAYLVAHKNRVVSHDAIERDVWKVGRAVITHAPAVAIRRLRSKIEPADGKPVNLVTVFGEGWMLVVPESKAA
ncbi:MAG: AraC family transcriptional regulator ligand-binding domain-containing protein [Alphaproteobacteria bacterium]|nr:AraC family transcriptional regulator ligand-binding domain-containing protein [Alphaproteobacteria bacterium]